MSHWRNDEPAASECCKATERQGTTCFKLVMKKLGLPDIRFHDLRHTYAVFALQSEDDIKTVQENLGHATAAFTLDIYGHVLDEMKHASASRMEKLIQGLAASQADSSPAVSNA